MKLAEALMLRADRNRGLEQLKQRIQVSARFQEGDSPPKTCANSSRWHRPYSTSSRS
jgi:hypothetical protein